jgi:hypothetical protein
MVQFAPPAEDREGKGVVASRQEDPRADQEWHILARGNAPLIPSVFGSAWARFEKHIEKAKQDSEAVQEMQSQIFRISEYRESPQISVVRAVAKGR